MSPFKAHQAEDTKSGSQHLLSSSLHAQQDPETPLCRSDDDNRKWTLPSRRHRIAYASTAQDRDVVRGTLCLLLYVGTWLLSCAATPITLLLFIFEYYYAAFLVTLSLILCFIIPVRPNKKFREYSRFYFSRYFLEASVRFEHVPDPSRDRPTIVCINPHGIFSLSWAHCYLTEELHHVQWCFSTLLGLSPYFRILTRLGGNPSNVRKATIIDHMTHQRSIAVIPGGWHEGTLHHPKHDRIYIRKRQGFIKYALQFGYTVTPTYGFGEKETYYNVPGGYRCRFWLNSRGILTVLAWGLWWCPFLPRRVKLHTVVGTPIELPHIPNPSRENVNYWHNVYMSHMVELYDRYKTVFYGEEKNLHLELW